jgi:preprotein translocase subunit SecG
MKLPIPELFVTFFFIITLAYACSSKPKKKNRPVNHHITKRTKTREKFINPYNQD